MPAAIQGLIPHLETHIENFALQYERHDSSINQGLQRSMEDFFWYVYLLSSCHHIYNFCRDIQRLAMRLRVLHGLRGSNATAIEIVSKPLGADAARMRSSQAEDFVSHINCPRSLPATDNFLSSNHKHLFLVLY